MKRSLWIAGLAAAVLSAALVVSGFAADKGETKGDKPAASAKSKFNKKVNVGDKAPEFTDLEGVDGKRHSLKDYSAADVIVVAFTCNHCPVAVAYEDRFVEFQALHKDDKVRFIAVSSSTNAEDSLEHMKVRAGEKDFNFPYLSDPSQRWGRAYGATVTPQLFVLDRERKIVYMGLFDDSEQKDAVKKHYVADAVKAVLAGKAPEVVETRAKGCGIEYN